ncbi:hypothetical protein SJAV_17470 [Sulfurisphaera javensis]|uniref:DUF2139 domain-containing protein n=1 Tax=Sulfurisphaera javensis TaxID=2049879 RepID=A0AAT9GSH3_9CREN
MYYICTENGLFRYDNKLERICCEDESVHDFIPPDTICTENGVYVRGRKTIEGECWRLYNLGKIVASVEGPKIYEIEGKLIVDLTDFSKKLGWEFPYGLPHITDFTLYKGKIIASVEEGNLLVGDTLNELKPIDFFADMHNLIVKNSFLLIATANALYKTDLQKFEVISRGYFHGLLDLGDITLAQVMSSKPLQISADLTHWKTLDIELPRPTFGVTAVDKIDDENIVYSTTSLYEINVRKIKYEKIVDLPLTRRVIVAN